MTIDPTLVDAIERRGLVSRGLTVAEIAARAQVPVAVCEAAVRVLVAAGRASPAHPRGRGLWREPTFKRGPSGMQLLQAAVR